jgi:hypothetical protein
MDAGTEPRQDEPKLKVAGHRLGYFLWRRPAVKCLWLLCTIFWVGGAIGLLVPAVGILYDTAFAGLLCSVLFPPLVFLYLAIGWARQEIDAGRIALGPAAPPRDRSVGGWSDPMVDPLDPRSPLHWQDRR